MKSVKIKLVRKGMVTATEVKDRMGRTLLTSDQSITEQNLKTLKAWGVTEVNIMSPDEPKKVLPEEGQAEVISPPAIIKEQEILFKYTDRRHPAIAELYDICLARKVQLGEEGQ
ncbi:MAG: hypothetical protein H8E42_01555 [Nitrospinae bacterium]|nr:hypothetical protein [Nitrospinota bacterium]MBL7019376.1 hypothetical protein [Nitrospinaceae bacterium]